MAKRGPWEKVGEIGVDAGLCWVGDPCYVLPDDVDVPHLRDWEQFCEAVAGKDSTQFPFMAGHAGLGVCVRTGYGDGVYPVEVRRKDGRIAEVRVKFM